MIGPRRTLPIDDAGLSPRLRPTSAGIPYRLETQVTNEDRTLGARLAGQLALFKSQNPTATGSSLTFSMKGIAGQSFGAFAVAGMTLQLEGLANDFVGKGLCGGELVLRGSRPGRTGKREAHAARQRRAVRRDERLAVCRGRAGERFAVRNSGALAIVEGVGDHGCEYMTGRSRGGAGRNGHQLWRRA